jgi:hypothetical protein
MKVFVAGATGAIGKQLVRVGGPIKTEEDPLEDDPPKTVRQSLGDYVFLYVGLGIVLVTVLFFAVRTWLHRGEG